MKATILYFSPSGNTRKVAELIEDELSRRGWDCSPVDVTGRLKDFTGVAGARRLASELCPHDLLVLGGPVYANHLHFGVMELIAALPQPGPGCGAATVPFVTYGGVSSGIALREAGRALAAGGRKVVAGLKVAAPHRMTRAFLERELNADIPPEPALAAVADLADTLGRLPYGGGPASALPSLSYNGLEAWIKATFVFRERRWHETRYPRVEIDSGKCAGCGACVAACPSRRLELGAGDRARVTEEYCIHCMNCASICPAGAIRLVGDIEKGRAFMAHMIEHHANREKPATAAYPLPRKTGPERGSKRPCIGALIRALDAPSRRKRMDPAEALRKAGLADAGRVLELGCGSGFFTAAAPGILAPGASYTALDLAPEAVAETRRKLAAAGATDLQVLRADARDTGLPEASFDLVLLFGIIPSPFLTLRELAPEALRLLAPGGRLAVWSLAPRWKPDGLERFGARHLGTKDGIHLYEKARVASDGA